MATDRGRAGLLVFAVALLLRLAFWQATPDATWPGSAHYLGDAALWVDYATAVAEGGAGAFELGLPLRPPANAWLLAWLGVADGGLAVAQVGWCLLGALACWLAFRAAQPAFGTGVALATGLACAGSTALMTLSTSLNNETPYLAVVMATLALGESLRQGATAGNGGPPRHRAWVGAGFAAWGLLAAAGCLLRAEHALFVVAATAWLGWAVLRPVARRRGAAACARPLVYGFLALALPLVLWHASAWAAVRDFNENPPSRADGDRYLVHRSQGRLLARLPPNRWTEAAQAEAQAWPAFARRTSRLFVELTALHRAGALRAPRSVVIDMAEVGVVEEAFGTAPEPLPAHPFIALYGGLNFHLANHAGATGGFSRGPLQEAPPLAGGLSAYPRRLVAGLPPGELVLTYPPHLAVVNHGWSRGLGWMSANPGDAAALVAEKLRRFWAGAALGLTGHGFPAGPGGVRWPVDLAVPEAGPGVSAWRWGLLLAALIGAAVGRPRVALVPWLLFLAARAATAAAFFGYARLGATVTPVVALLVSLAAARLLAPWLHRVGATRRRRRALAIAAALLLVTAEAARWLDPPTLRLDGQAVTATGPFPADDPEPRALTVVN